MHLDIDVASGVGVVTVLRPWSSRSRAHDGISVSEFIHDFVHQSLPGHLLRPYADAVRGKARSNRIVDASRSQHALAVHGNRAAVTMG